MQLSEKRKTSKYLGKAVLLALLIVFLVRTLLFESLSVSSDQMEATLINGDRVIVDKTAYGIKLPQTILTIPFTFDSVFGFKSYSDLILIPYCRVFSSKVSVNDVVLFNSPENQVIPYDKGELLISRCVALPGDSVQMIDGELLINEKAYVFSPNSIQKYLLDSVQYNLVQNIVPDSEQFISLYFSVDTAYSLEISNLDRYLLNQYLPDSLKILPTTYKSNDFSFRIPYKGMKINISDPNFKLYKIIFDRNNKISLSDNSIEHLNDVGDTECLIFDQDYYWLLSDNSVTSVDSRSLGFIPFSRIIGKVRYIWYSSGKDRSLSKVN